MGEVSLIDVSKRFALRIDGDVQTVRALDRLSFTVADGEVVALIGPSGCGKTTALRIAMGLETATSGAVTVDGTAVKGCGYDRGIVFQHAELLPWLTALQERGVRPGNEGHARRRAARHRDEISDAGRPADSVKRRPYQLSGGMQQRVGIARALAIDPKVLADGRAVRRARRADARGFAGRAVGNPRPHQKDDPVRHPRSRRSGAARRPGRGDAARPACKRS